MFLLGKNLLELIFYIQLVMHRAGIVHHSKLRLWNAPLPAFSSAITQKVKKLNSQVLNEYILNCSQQKNMHTNLSSMLFW